MFPDSFFKALFSLSVPSQMLIALTLISGSATALIGLSTKTSGYYAPKYVYFSQEKVVIYPVAGVAFLVGIITLFHVSWS